MFGIDRRTLYIVMGVLVVMSIGSYISNPTALVNLIITIPAVLIAITFHEYAHAFAADKLGDDTPRRQGRLNLNPLSHLDPIGSIMLLFAGFGWGKPVEINPRNFDRKYSMKTAEAIVSIAGPLMNFILAIVATIIYFAVAKFMPFAFENLVGSVIMTMIQYIVVINIGLGVFNLIPLPPLDGSKVLMAFLPYNAVAWMEKNERIFYIIFVVLWITNIAGIIISPLIQGIYGGMTGLAASIFGVKLL